MKFIKENHITSSIIALAIFASLAFVPIASYAHNHHHNHWHRHHWHGHHWHDGPAFAGGALFGAAAGIMVGSALSNHYYYSCRPYTAYHRHCRVSRHGDWHCYTEREVYRDCY